LEFMRGAAMKGNHHSNHDNESHVLFHRVS
jgi:hypothetical protein